MATLRIHRDDELRPEDRRTLRAILDAAWGDPFPSEDWDHMLGGLHFVLELGGAIVSHAAVVDRELHAGGHQLRTAYVEAVATWPELQRGGFGTTLMRAVNEHILRSYPLGGLDTGRPGFFERLGWRRWRGPTYVRTAEGPIRTPEEEGNVMVLLTPTSPPLDLDEPIGCEWRPGDVW